MQICYSKPSVEDFDKVPIGELFAHQGNLFMKIECVENSVNAINMETGNADFFAYDMEVRPVKGKLVIKDS